MGDNGVCDKKCKAKKECHLDDETDAKFHTRDVSCKMKCVGFNMHGDNRCTLFGEGVKLRKSGHDGNQFYTMPGEKAPFIVGVDKEDDEESDQDDKEPEEKEEDS